MAAAQAPQVLNSALRRYALRAAPVGASLSGILAYFVFMYSTSGNIFEGFDAQKHFENHPSVSNILDLPRFLQSAGNIGQLHGMVDSLLDRCFFVLFLILLPAIWRMNMTYFCYALLSGLVPAMSNQFLSYTRFLVLCFPVFIAMAEKLRGHDLVFGMCWAFLE